MFQYKNQDFAVILEVYDDANTNFMNGSVCLANIGESFKRPGPKKTSFRFLSVVYGLIGGDR